MTHDNPFENATKFVDRFSASLIFDSAVRELIKRDKEIEALLKAVNKSEDLAVLLPEVLQDQAAVELLWKKATTTVCYGTA